jgi:hypothetical protein
MLQIVEERESIKVLRECIETQIKKGNDYQNPNSNVKQAMHYRRGIDSIHDLIQGKLYRAQSLLEAASAGSDAPNYESIEDSYKDLINYASFAVMYLRGKMDGQDSSRDMFNRRYPETTQGIPATQGVISDYRPDSVTPSSSVSNAVDQYSKLVDTARRVPNGDRYS